ncbi:MAG: hypothetical protein KF693_02090 [Nitrospira sp.]|nr:hypothetical protein [Nitrospira sp.]
MTQPLKPIMLCGTAIVLLFIVSGCASSIYGWQVRTSSTPMASSFSPVNLGQEPVALFEAVASSGKGGNEVALSYYLESILQRLALDWKIVGPQEVVARVNRAGLTASYAIMRSEYGNSNILDREILRKLAAAIEVRYIFQPRLVEFTQTMTDRSSAPLFDVRLSQTRSSIMRLVLQLWDAETGELIWGSLAEATMQKEGVSQDPVYLQDISRVALGSIISDFMNRRTSSQYTPVNQFLNHLIEEAIPKEQKAEDK